MHMSQTGEAVCSHSLNTHTHTHTKMHEECQTSTTKKGFNCEKTSFLQASNLDICENNAFNNFYNKNSTISNVCV